MSRQSDPEFGGFRIQEVTCHVFFRVMDSKSAAEQICGVVHYVNYTADFPFRMGGGMKSDFDTEFSSNSASKSVV